MHQNVASIENYHFVTISCVHHNLQTPISEILVYGDFVSIILITFP
jgi:hypothetical protein